MAHARLPGGARRKASQRRSWRTPPPTAWVTPDWPPGARSRGLGASVCSCAKADDDQVEVLIGSRTYRVRRAEVRSA